ncbi:hypothetical protein [Dialister sp.]|jgi:hypothetical protein|uniref:hypothetical protein n=1 Tax=Dialister sp. TaxID=1955814 RepID=UPI003A5C3155
MKKILFAFGMAAAIAAGSLSVSAANLWKYNDTVSIDMDEASVKHTTNGHEILNFVAVEAIEGGTCTYTYAYDRTAGTIQVVEMEKETNKLHYTSNFTPTSINSTNPVIRARAQMAEAVYQRKVNHKK